MTIPEATRTGDNAFAAPEKAFVVKSGDVRFARTQVDHNSFALVACSRGPARAGAIIPLQGPPADPAPCPQVIPRLFDTTQEARVTFETVFEPVLVSLEARPACHGAKGGLQRRLRCRGRCSVGCAGA
jgi:hypothetical protein